MSNYTRIAFKLPLDGTPIQLPKDEKWTIHFTSSSSSSSSSSLLIEFGSTTSTGIIYNTKALSKFQKQYPSAQLELCTFNRYSKIPITSPIEGYEVENKFDDDTEKYFPGDSLPYPYKSNKELDEELEQYALVTSLTRKQ